MSTTELLQIIKTIATFVGMLVSVIAPVIAYFANRWRKAEAETKTLYKEQNLQLIKINAELTDEVRRLNTELQESAKRSAETTKFYTSIIDKLTSS